MRALFSRPQHFSLGVSYSGHVFVFRSRRSSQVAQRSRRRWKNKIAREEEAACVRSGERKEKMRRRPGLFSSAEDLGCAYFGPRRCIPGRRENGRPSFARSREERTYTRARPLGFANPENMPRLVPRTGHTCAVLTSRETTDGRSDGGGAKAATRTTSAAARHDSGEVA